MSLPNPPVPSGRRPIVTMCVGAAQQRSSALPVDGGISDRRDKVTLKSPMQKESASYYAILSPCTTIPTEIGGEVNTVAQKALNK